MAVTLFDQPYQKSQCYTQTSRLYVLQNPSYDQSKFYIAGTWIIDFFAPVTLALTR